ncbi:hypothetical protein O3P69_016833 [Scylla paramamosain]|uniref:Uncharacterized protein n=1 Tax=Scylla paramamosain TaxID=85552 RepID=A0AAW0T0K2_SCYPA
MIGSDGAQGEKQVRSESARRWKVAVVPRVFWVTGSSEGGQDLAPLRSVNSKQLVSRPFSLPPVCVPPPCRPCHDAHALSRHPLHPREGRAGHSERYFGQRMPAGAKHSGGGCGVLGVVGGEQVLHSHCPAGQYLTA